MDTLGGVGMTNLKENVNHYMKLKGIKKYSHLLVDVAHQLGIRGQDAYAFAEREKANFSKMLNEQRQLKYEFIIPLETIFGVPLARLLNQDMYKLPMEKENVPFNKGFRYYAYLDDPDLYSNEFARLSTSDGKPILCNLDEFGKSFLDYIVEYSAVNGVRYLHDEYGIKLKWYRHDFELAREKGNILVNFDNALAFARLVASMDDVELFNDIYDSYNMFFTNGHYGGQSSLFNQSDYLEIIMDSDKIFKSLFEIKKYNVALGEKGKRKTGIATRTYYSVNPILNNCLHYALCHLNKYRKAAIEILKFAIDYNRRVAKENGISNCYICNELGAIRNIKNDQVYEFVFFVEEEDYNDDEINKLIGELIKFKKY